jgi:hypothetical protein
MIVNKNQVKKEVLQYLSEKTPAGTNVYFSISDIGNVLWKNEEYRRKHVGQLPQEAYDLIAEVIWDLVGERIVTPFYDLGDFDSKRFVINGENRYKLMTEYGKLE